MAILISTIQLINGKDENKNKTVSTAIRIVDERFTFRKVNGFSMVMARNTTGGAININTDEKKCTHLYKRISPAEDVLDINGLSANKAITNAEQRDTAASIKSQKLTNSQKRLLSPRLPNAGTKGNRNIKDFVILQE